MAGGTYTLVIELPEDATVTVGALGDRTLDAGWYAYVGSARGPGGFARVERHRELARGERDARHWHIDHLLGRPAAILADVVRSPGADVECAVAAALRAELSAVPGVGASDCGCGSHLFFSPEEAILRAATERAHA
ncbi:MAG: DUF123 domain-containing protein [Halobacteriales archaeon]